MIEQFVWKAEGRVIIRIPEKFAHICTISDQVTLSTDRD